MSEITLITRRYDDITDFTNKVNKSIIVFKKKHLLEEQESKDKYPKLKIDAEEIKKAKDDLLSALIQLEKLQVSTETPGELRILSENSELKKNILDKHTSRKEIELVIQHLKEQKPLEKMNFLILDKIISALDNERNQLFRKLRTARG